MLIPIIMKVSNMIKIRGNLSESADMLGISRPTLYKYMQLYDEGMMKQIPTDVLDFFDKMVSDDTNKELLRRKLECELKKTDVEVIDLTRELDGLKNRGERIKNELSASEDMDPMEAAKLKEQYADVCTNIEHISKHLMVSQCKRNELMKSYYMTDPSISEPHEVEERPASIATKCLYEKGAFMIIFDDPNSNGSDHILSLMTKFDDKYKTIGTYDTVEGKDFFLIKDIVYSPQLHFSVSRVTKDPNGKKIIDKNHSSRVRQFRR